MRMDLGAMLRCNVVDWSIGPQKKPYQDSTRSQQFSRPRLVDENGFGGDVAVQCGWLIDRSTKKALPRQYSKPAIFQAPCWLMRMDSGAMLLCNVVDWSTATQKTLTETVLEAGNFPGPVLVDENGLGGDVAVQHPGARVQEPQALGDLPNV